MSDNEEVLLKNILSLCFKKAVQFLLSTLQLIPTYYLLAYIHAHTYVCTYVICPYKVAWLYVQYAYVCFIHVYIC